MSRARFVSGLIAVFSMVAVHAGAAEDELVWTEAPPLPVSIGLGGPFAGVHEGALIVAGGANFPAGPPWEGGEKVWHADVYVLPEGAEEWLSGFSLPHPLAYGVSISTRDGVLIIGGNDDQKAYPNVWRLRWNPGDRSIEIDSLTDLPEASAYGAGGLIGRTLYVLGGQASANSPAVVDRFWALDLDADAGSWEELEPFPGRPRIKAVAAVQVDGVGKAGLYIFSGEISERDDQGGVNLEYVTDGYRFDPTRPEGDRWKPIADSPHPVAAAGAIGIGQTHILVFSGSTGEYVNDPPENQPLFPSDVLAYHTITDTWRRVGAMPQGVVTTAVAQWNDSIVVASGEIRPGVRTPAIQVARIGKGGAGFGVVNSVVLIAYLAVVVAMGWHFSRREKSTEDFFLAGHRIPWWAAGMSIYSTQLSAITFIALPALTFAGNWVVVPGSIMILAMAPIVVAFYLPFFRRLNVTTAYEYLERRFNLAVRLLGSVIFIIFQLGRIAVVVYLPALALSAVTGMDIYVCILAMGVLAIIYTALGGMEAVVWTDVLQTIILLGGLVISLIVVLWDMGGLRPILDLAAEGDKLRLFEWNLDWVEMATWSVLLGTFMLQFGPYTADQAVIQRYMTTKDEKAGARGIWLNGWMSVLALPLFYLLGTGLYAFFKSHPETLTLGMQNDQAFPLFVASRLPAGISGLIIAGVFAASMSSLDSSMHSVSTVCTIDFYGRFRSGASDADLLRVARGVVIAVGILGVALACTLARYEITSLFFFFQKILGLVTNGLVGIFILGIFTRRASSGGVIVGAVASTVLTAYVALYTPVHFYLYPVIGIPVAVAVGLAASPLFREQEKDLAGLTLATLERRSAQTSESAPKS